MAESVTVNGERLLRRLAELAKIGATPKGGVSRLAFTDLDKEGRDLFVRWCKELGLAVRVDAMGNIFARYGTGDLAPVMSGSHLDSQPTGGKYDGAYGVLAALESVNALIDEGIRPRRPIDVVAWSNEEGSRFAPSMVGSGVYAGVFTLDYAYSRKNRDEGVTQGEEIARIGYKGEMPCRAGPVHRYFELHIEQGPVLDDKRLRVGVVEGVFGIEWLELAIAGEQNHAGSTPMAVRRDPMMAAAEIIASAESLPAKLAGTDGRLTVGCAWVKPNSVNVIPGEVVFTVDMRAKTQDKLDAIVSAFRSLAQKVAKKREVRLDFKQLSKIPPVVFDKGCCDTVEEVTRESQLSYQRMHSGPGHDAVFVSKVAPTGMIFVPSIGGISHAETEETKPEDLIAGCNVLANALLKSANG